MVVPVWEEITDVAVIAAELISKRPDWFGGIDSQRIIAYACVNRKRPPGSTCLYEMMGMAEPESFMSRKRYFVKLYKSDWDAAPESCRVALVASALFRINSKRPGVIGPGRDDILVKMLGHDWWQNPKIPNLLTSEPVRKDESPRSRRSTTPNK